MASRGQGHTDKVAAVKLIRSAGGVVWRSGADGPEIAVVHRDRYDDWSLPKGKLDPGEHELIAAVREVREETGAIAVPTARLPGTRYLTGEPGTEKSVDFWTMEVLTETTFTPNDEISALRWMTAAAADDLLTYAHDRGIVAAFAAHKPVTGVAVLVRHGHAGSRSAWAGNDDLRPLDADGKRQAAALAPLLSLFKPSRVYAAPLTRCVDTVAQVGLPVHNDTVFAEATEAAPKAVAERLRSLVASHGRVVVASQGGVIPAAVAALRPPHAPVGTTFATRKGSAWVLSFSGRDLVAADPLSL
jgi:8-oxo-dGTP diphosphatase